MTMGRWERVARALALGFVGYLLLGLVTVQVSQRVFRHRVELLLADLTVLRNGPGGGNELQQLQGKWGPWDETCSSGERRYHFQTTDTVDRIFYWSITTQPASRLRLWLGTAIRTFLYVPTLAGHSHFPAVVTDITVKDGLVTRQSFGTFTAVPDGTAFRLYPDGYTLMAGYDWQRDHLKSDQTTLVDWPEHTSHPESMAIEPGRCMDCKKISAVVTAFTPADEAESLMRINPECLTQWEPCATDSDIMAAATIRYHEDLKRWQEQLDRLDHCKYSYEQLIAAAENVALVSVFASGKDGESLAQIRVERQLKGVADLVRDQRIGLATGGWTRDYAPAFFTAGKKLIVLYPASYNAHPPSDILRTYSCGILPAKEVPAALLATLSR